MKKTRIFLEVRGGIVDVTKMPRNTELVLKDYDIEAYSANELKKDKEGNEYKEITFITFA